uniref:Uncharacterized protein n=1 Tax=Rhizophora mucronata TaxID=61149 RepID=A0A2P2K1W6_RHIMU
MARTHSRTHPCRRRHVVINTFDVW